MKNLETIINFSASIITILLFLLMIYKNRGIITSYLESRFHYLLNFREIHQEDIQKFDRLITPYKPEINLYWKRYTQASSIFIIFTGSVVSFVKYNVDQKSLLYSLLVFFLYYGISLWMKWMEKNIQLS